MLKKLINDLFAGKQRSWTVEEVRALIAEKKLLQAQLAADRLYEITPHREWTRASMLAEIAFRDNRDEDAERGFREVLKAAPGFADAHYGLSLVLLEQGNTAAAVEHSQFARNADPNDARYLAQLGLCQVTAGNFPSAELPLTQAVQMNDKDKASWNNLGVVLLAKRVPAEAHACFMRALTLDPGFASARQNLERLEREMNDAGAVLIQKNPPLDQIPGDASEVELEPWEHLWSEVETLRKDGLTNAALARAEAICTDWADLPGPVCRLEALYRKMGESQSGIDALQAYLLVHPHEGEARATLGSALLCVNEHAMAEKHLRQAIEDGFESATAVSDLANALNTLDKHAEAIEFRRVAVQLEPTFKYKAQLASSLVVACQYDEALELFEELIKEDPEKENVLMSYAVACAYVGRFDRSLELMNEAILKQPHGANIRLLRAQVNLLMGNFKTGWEDYGYRGLAHTKHYRVLPFNKWQGEDLQGKCIVVLAEQGLGDQVMLASCLPDLCSLGPARVIVEAMERVAPTLARSFPECEVVHTRQDKGLEWVKALGHVDYFVPLGDLPQRFRGSVDAFPGTPYLKPDPERVTFWRKKLEEAGPRPWIGVSWRGGMQATRQILRTMSPSDLAPLAAGTTATWISLQYGSVEEDLKIAEVSSFKLTHWGEAIRDLDEFAALIQALDCVVTVCNTTVHYAGALGKRVLVLAPQIPEWRYGLTPRMPWYANVTVLHQSRANEWQGVVYSAKERLADIFEHDATKLS